jgi:ubiquinone/menaquinone biosynthesis C-methylase UbiE
MARTNRTCAAWVIDLLHVQSSDRVLEIGFGPGVGIQLLTRPGSAEYVAGADPSRAMVMQATTRNRNAIESGRVDLRRASAESLPFEDETFDKAVAINSMQVWPDAVAGLREMRRCMKTGGKVALGFTPYSGQPNSGLAETLTAAGFANAHVLEKDKDFCALGTKS